MANVGAMVIINAENVFIRIIVMEMFRIIPIKSCKTCDQVLLMIERDENGIDNLKIIAWHEENDVRYYQEEVIPGCENEDTTLIERMLVDFSEFSANVFANSFTF